MIYEFSVLCDGLCERSCSDYHVPSYHFLHRLTLGRLTPYFLLLYSFRVSSLFITEFFGRADHEAIVNTNELKAVLPRNKIVRFKPLRRKA